MERNPEWRGDEPGFDEIQYIKYGSQDAVERALHARRDRHGRSRSRRRRSSGSARSRTSRRCRARRRLHAARVQPVLRGGLPGRRVQPGGPGARGAPGDRLRGRPRAHQRRSPRKETSFVANGDPALVLQVVLRRARADLSVRPGAGEPDPRRRRLGRQRRRAAHEGRRGALVRPLRALGVAVQHPGGEAGRGDGAARSASSSTSRSSASTSSTS